MNATTNIMMDSIPHTQCILRQQRAWVLSRTAMRWTQGVNAKVPQGGARSRIFASERTYSAW